MAKTNAKRSETTLRLPASLLRRIDRLTEHDRRELEPTWSRNAEIVRLLSDAVARAEAGRE